MKFPRAILLPILAAMLLALPAAAQAWVVETYSYDTGLYTPATAPLTVSASATNIDLGGTVSNTGLVLFRVLSNDLVTPQTLTITRSVSYGGKGGPMTQWSYNQNFFIADGSIWTSLAQGSASNKTGTRIGTAEISTGTLYGFMLTANAKQWFTGIAPVSSFAEGQISILSADTTAKTPLPASLFLLAPGLAGVAALRRRFKN